MLITLATGRTVNLHFVHSSHNFVSREGAPSLRQAIDDDARNMGRRLTLCEVSQVSFSGDSTGNDESKSYATLAQGVSICHPKDTFEKAVGRKKALTKALLVAGLNYDERAAVWASYRDTYEK